MGKKYFGTDGIRGQVGVFPITPEFAMHLGYAIGQVFHGNDKPKVLIGKDTRISNYMFEACLEAGLAAAGCNVYLLGPMPTPAIAYLTRTFRADAGIVISASHNPFSDNGFKIFSAQGLKLSDQVELDIEEYLDQNISLASASNLGRAWRIDDAPARYIEFCKGVFPSEWNLSGIKLVIDCANGATYHVSPKVFAELGAAVIEIAVEPNGTNINLDCGSTKPDKLQQAVLDNQADLGIALDGDGDRLIMVDHLGEIVNGDELLMIIYDYLQARGRFHGGVVGTEMTNFGLEMALINRGVYFVRAKVGDRYVSEQLTQRNWVLGGESSGHIICRLVQTTGDGTIAALIVLAALVRSQKQLHELKKMMIKLPQVLINVPHNGRQHELLQRQTVQQAISQINQRLDGKGRVLLRFSGTEPIVRVMVEGEDQVLVQSLAEDLAQTVQNECAI